MLLDPARITFGSKAAGDSAYAWIFGNLGLSGGKANVTIGSKNFLLQENWLQVPNGGQCLQGYTPGPATPPSAPQSPAASAGYGAVGLTWSAPSTNGGATITGYSIYRSASTGGEGATPYATVGAVSSHCL